MLIIDDWAKMADQGSSDFYAAFAMSFCIYKLKGTVTTLLSEVI